MNQIRTYSKTRPKSVILYEKEDTIFQSINKKSKIDNGVYEKCLNSLHLVKYPIVYSYSQNIVHFKVSIPLYSVFFVTLVEQKMLTLMEHLSSLPDFSGVRVT
jgi:hypothetical protein